jgi:hypothetical protein
MDDPTRSPVRRRAILLIAVIFVLGMACGAALFFLGQRSVGIPGRPGHHPPGHFMERLAHELDLDDDQRREIEAIFGAQRARLHGILEEFRQTIRAVLRPDQQERFDRLRPPRHFGRGGPLPGHPPPPPGARHPHPDPPPLPPPQETP